MKIKPTHLIVFLSLLVILTIVTLYSKQRLFKEKQTVKDYTVQETIYNTEILKQKAANYIGKEEKNSLSVVALEGNKIYAIQTFQQVEKYESYLILANIDEKNQIKIHQGMDIQSGYTDLDIPSALKIILDNNLEVIIKDNIANIY